MRIVHGGDVTGAARRLGRAANELLDLSANINPAGPPERVRTALAAAARDPEALAAYPDPRYGALREVLARRHGVDERAIAIGNGSAALIGAIVRALRPLRCVLPIPSFSEYRKALAAERVETVALAREAPGFALDLDRLSAAIARSRAELVILTNPNNPTGTLIPGPELRAFLRASPFTTVFVVDEAFIDYVPQHSVAVGAAPNVVVLRSLTKFYALAGVRVGYAVGSAELVGRIEESLPSWPVGTLDATLAAAAPGDAGYEDRTRRANERERALLTAGLQACGIDVTPSSANFVLGNVAARWRGSASALADRLASAGGVLVRACDDYPGLEDGCWIRIAVRTRPESERALAVLRAVLES